MSRPETISFDTHPSRYRHWRFTVDGDVARLLMDVQEEGGLDPSHVLKLNSYDLSVDLELADAVQRLRFEHPEVRVVVVGSAKDRAFCAGANIPMLASSTHAFKVNFCKFTNETRLGIEDASRTSGVRFLAAVSGACAGGGYELAMACDEILLIDDRSSAVSLPEVPLLGVLPGTGGLTRLVDKRKVRRDRADVFCTLGEGIKGKRAVEWGLVDAVASKSQYADAVGRRARALADSVPPKAGRAGVALPPLAPEIGEGGLRYEHVDVVIDGRVATVTLTGPASVVTGAEAMQAAGASYWPLAVMRQLDDALLQLRFNHEDVGLLVLKTRGDAATLLATEQALWDARDDWFANEVLGMARRTLKRLETSARSLFAVADAGSCFAGLFLEVLLAADRSYMLNDPSAAVHLQVGPLNRGALPMGNGLSRLESRFLDAPERVAEVLAVSGPIDAEEADTLGLVTFAPDELDWEDEVRLAVEERASMSPDALTGMEASLRFAGPETLETKIFGRLSAWQNWIFQRPNAVGERGALKLYGKPERPELDWRRTG
ncbi:MAG: enoyl-CoA hydratase [Myxococcales bacterium]